MNTQDFNEEIKPLSDKWTNDLVKDGLFNREMTSEKIQSLAEEPTKHHCPISPEQYEKLCKETEMLESKIEHKIMNLLEDNTMFFRVYFTKYVKVTVMFNKPIKSNFKVYKFKVVEFKVVIVPIVDSKVDIIPVPVFSNEVE
jgi:hypothetical protein